MTALLCSHLALESLNFCCIFLYSPLIAVEWDVDFLCTKDCLSSGKQQSRPAEKKRTARAKNASSGCSTRRYLHALHKLSVVTLLFFEDFENDVIVICTAPANKGFACEIQSVTLSPRGLLSSYSELLLPERSKPGSNLRSKSSWSPLTVPNSPLVARGLGQCSAEQAQVATCR